ncbi:MAG: hypothetical protein ACXVCV_03835 [Polyangia bacterium]
MRVLRIGIIVTVGLGILGIDVGESVRQGAISDASAHAKRHKHHRKHARHRHRKHHAASEM